MSNYKLSTGIGNHFSQVSKEAKEIAIRENIIVEFDFNGIICLVNKDTNLDLLNRDYSNSFIMEWKTIGPNFNEVYSNEIQVELAKRIEIKEHKEKERQELQEQEDRKKKSVLERKINNIIMDFSDKDSWDKGRALNTVIIDPYCYVYADLWARLMQKEIIDGKYDNIDAQVLSKFASECSHEADIEGITGFMYGAAISILVKSWKHGEALKKWYNKKYNHEGEGVVNPAVITLKN